MLLLNVLIIFECYAQYPSKRDLEEHRQGRGNRKNKIMNNESMVRIGRLIGTGRQVRVKTPEFRTRGKMGQAPAQAKEWARIALEYDTFPKWIDSLTIKYKVLTMQRKGGDHVYGLYEATVEYGDIKKGRKHVSAVFLRPSTVRRYGLPVAVHVEMYVEGNVVGTKTEVEESVNLPKNWWENNVVLNNPKVKLRDGYLLNRSQTPFSLINIDNYEAIR